MRRSPHHLVKEFHETFGVPVETFPSLPDTERMELRRKLIEEEFAEFELALASQDLVEVADALADMVYVIYGAALEFGIPLDVVIAEVHRSNMTKLWEWEDLASLPDPGDGIDDIEGYEVQPGKWVVQRGDGKVMKPPSYSSAKVDYVLKLAEFWHRVWPGEVL
jgi:predicted HAD superfamily Cof-like phosphohydrolase